MLDERVLATIQNARLIIFFSPGDKQDDYNAFRVDDRVGNNRPKVIVEIGKQKCVAGSHNVIKDQATRQLPPPRRRRLRFCP